MEERTDMKTLAKLYRECADILDKMSEETDEERLEELLAAYMVKVMRVQAMS